MTGRGAGHADVAGDPQSLTAAHPLRERLHAAYAARHVAKNVVAAGHFGRDEPDFTWERTGVAGRLRGQAGLPATGIAPGAASAWQRSGTASLAF
jgi:hypothetical protein